MLENIILGIMSIINNKSKIFFPEKKQETLYYKGNRWVRQNGNPLSIDSKGGLGITGIRRPNKILVEENQFYYKIKHFLTFIFSKYYIYLQYND